MYFLFFVGLLLKELLVELPHLFLNKLIVFIIATVTDFNVPGEGTNEMMSHTSKLSIPLTILFGFFIT